MDRRLLEALRMVKGQGQMSAKDKYGWHPPLSDEGDAMPNQPRDISKSGGSKNPFLEGKSAADFGQDAFGEPVPDKLQMAKVNGAMRLPAPQQAAPTSMKDMMGLPLPSGEELVDPRGDAKTQSIAREHPGHMVVSVDPSSYFGDDAEEHEIMSKASAIPYTMPKAQRQAFKGPSSATAFQMGGEDDPSGAQPESSDSSNSGDLSGVGEYPESIPMDDMTDEIDIDTGSNPDQTADQGAEAAPEAAPAQKSALQQYIDQMNGEGEASKDRDLSGVLNAQQKMNSDMGLYKLLFASANKIGSHAGQQSSDEPFNSFADGAVKSNDKRSDLAMKDRQDQKKRQDDKLRALMFQQKQADDERKYGNQLKFQRDQLTQLAHDKEEGRKVQRDSNAIMAQLRDDQIRASLGLGQGKLDLEAGKMHLENDIKNRDLDAKIAIAGSDQGHKGNILKETTRHNQAMEAAEEKKAKAEKEANKHKAKGISQGAAKTDMFRKRMAHADDAFAKLSTKPGFDATSTKDTVLGAMPFVGNSLISKDRQLQDQFQQEFVQATLRDESGASIGTNEYNSNMKKYFPVYGDSKETIARKALLRKADIKTLQEAYDVQKGEAEALGGEASSMGTLPAPPPGKVRVKDPETGKPLLIDEADLQEALKDGAERM